MVCNKDFAAIEDSNDTQVGAPRDASPSPPPPRSGSPLSVPLFVFIYLPPFIHRRHRPFGRFCRLPTRNIRDTNIVKGPAVSENLLYFN